MKPETRKAQQRHKQQRAAYRRKRLQDPLYASKIRAYHQQYQRRWYLLHREERSAYNRQYYQARVKTARTYAQISRKRLFMRWYRWWKRYEWQPLRTVEVSCLY